MSQTLLIIVVAALAFVIVGALGLAVGGGDASKERALKRAQAIGSATRDTRRTRQSQLNNADLRRRQLLKSLQEQERRQKKARLTLSSKLQQAGLSATVTQFWIASAFLGVAVFGLLFLLRIFLPVALGAGVITGLGLPHWLLGFLGKRRTNKFTATFSDAMDVIVRGIKSGLPVHDCLKIISRETAEPLRGEFGRLVENIGMGMTLDQALEKLEERMPTAEVRFFAIVMNIQQKTGGNLAEALNNLSTVLRSRKLMREKIKALSSEATASAGIIGSLPPGVVVLITVTTPSYMSPMFHDHRGWFMLGVSAVMMAAGVWVMRRMINFKF